MAVVNRLMMLLPNVVDVENTANNNHNKMTKLKKTKKTNNNHTDAPIRIPTKDDFVSGRRRTKRFVSFISFTFSFVVGVLACAVVPKSFISTALLSLYPLNV